ncbi:ABC transporter permease [Desulfomarina sp.]
MELWRELICKPMAFLIRDFRIAASYRLQFIMQGTGVLFTSTLFFMLARMIGDQKLASLESYGGDYFSFLLIGVAVTDYLSLSTSSFAAEIRSGQTLGTLESLLVSPTSIMTILFSSYMYKLLSTSFRLLFYFMLGFFVFQVRFHSGSIPALLLAFLLLLLPFVGIGLLSAAFIIVFKQGSPVSFLLNVSSGLLGGAMYPVAVLPDWLQHVSKILPITYGLEALRQVLLNGAGLREIYGELSVLAIFSVVFPAAGICAIILAVRIARKEGSLLHY